MAHEEQEDYQVVNENTGEIIPVSQSETTAIDLYSGISLQPFSPEAIGILLEEIDPLKISIRPDGIVYYEQNEYRRRLNRAFGPGGWAIRPLHIGFNPDDNLVTYEGALFAHGRFVSQAIGAHHYQPTNKNSDYASAAESAKSDCLTRCCKDLGIASELWDKEYVQNWLNTYAVEVWCKNNEGAKRKMWRKKTAPPIDQWPWKEEGQNGNSSANTSRTNQTKRTPPKEKEPERIDQNTADTIDALGVTVYGDDWVSKREQLTSAITKGFTGDYLTLTPEEGVKLLNGLKKKREEVAA